ncbi:MAG: hypothetical protein ACREPV_12145 [Lysobacter sp.]
MNNVVACPHCHGEVPFGAKVCRGCQAEVEYGTPPAAALLVFLLAFFGAWYVGSSFGSAFGWVALVVFLGGGIYLCQRAFKHRVSFKRIYRTR